MMNWFPDLFKYPVGATFIVSKAFQYIVNRCKHFTKSCTALQQQKSLDVDNSAWVFQKLETANFNDNANGVYTYAFSIL